MKKGKYFEDLISWIHMCLAENARVVPNAKIPDKDSGELRQVDIAIHVTEEPYRMLIVVEVRDRKRPVGSGYIEEIESKRDSVGADAAVIISKSGFTKPAKQKAVRHDIRIMTYDEALQHTWVEWAKMRTITVINRVFEVLNVDIPADSICDDNSAKDFAALSNAPLQPAKIKFQAEGEDKQFDANSLVNVVLNQNPSMWADVEPNAPPVRKKFQIDITPQPIRLVAGTSLIPVRQLRITLNLKIVEEERQLTLSSLRSMENGSSVSDVLSAKIPFGNGTAKLEIMTKGGSKVIEAGQKVFFRVVPLP